VDWKRGFNRATLLASLLAFTSFVIGGLIKWRQGDFVDWHPVYYYGTKKIYPFWTRVVFGIACFVGIWIIYGIVRWAIIPPLRWIARGFRDDASKNIEKERGAGNR